MIGPKQFLLGGIALFALTSFATAADIPARGPVYTKAPVPISLWEGVYIGVHGGYAWADSAVISAIVDPTSPSGGFGGFQFGYNYHIAPNWVLGYEVDVSFGDISDVSGLAVFGDQKVEVFGTARARLGYVQGPWMFYATAGAAYAKHELNRPAALFALDRPQVGWTVGAGLEYALSRNWSAKVEYLYADFGDSFTDGPLINELSMSSVRLGLNYRFDNLGAAHVAPAYPVKAPAYAVSGWSGAYIGIHGGYSWGTFDSVQLASPALLDPSGGIFGIQSGYNWHLSRNWVIGIESDASWGSVTDANAAGNVDIDAMGTVRARLGYAINNVLVYGTGGFAWAHADSFNAGAALVYDRYLFGWTVGAGVEWAIASKWTAKVEYAFTDLSFSEVVIANPVNDNLETHTIKIGLNYRSSLLSLLTNR